MSGIIIGKHTLESLTSGMYSESYVVFREYIQNSVDSIDEAVRTGVLEAGKGQIVVRLSPIENRIVITDNGLGVPFSDAENRLISIGNSQKTSETSRGFRGIGRLAALSYCRKLTFISSFKGESKAAEIEINASRLAELLADDSQNDITVEEVLEKVCTVSELSEHENAHYFCVRMDGVDANSRLLSSNDVEDYLSQNAPVPYSPDFIWGKEISNRLKSEGAEIESYNIILEYGNLSKRIFKPYKDQFVVDKSKNITDRIRDINIIKFNNELDEISAVGWLAKTDYRGSVYDKAIKGIRLRKGNILVGDGMTLNVIFKDARFNGWTIGEIFILDKKLIPNARRDNFEKNSAYFFLFEQLTHTASEITKEIRNASLRRNAELSEALNKVQTTVRQASGAIDKGVSNAEKVLITKNLKEAQDAISKSGRKEETEKYYQDIAFDELDMLIGKLSGATKYKALNTIDSLTNTEKKILERVIWTIESLNIRKSDQIIDAIISEFSK